jgi:hypothetical protein
VRDVASHQQPDSQRHEHCCQECDRPNMEGTVIRGWAPRLGDTDHENPPRRALARSRATGLWLLTMFASSVPPSSTGSGRTRTYDRLIISSKPGSAPYQRFINGRALRHGLAGHDAGAALVVHGDLAVD